MTTILVTGSEWYLGKYIVVSLKDRGYKVYAYDILNGDDINNKKQLKDILKNVSVVIHAAWIWKPLIKVSFNEYWQRNNVTTKNLVELCAQMDVEKFIYLSSTSYYGAEKGVPLSFPIDINSPTISRIAQDQAVDTSPDNLYYSVSKVIAEQIIAAYSLSFSMRTFILRLAPVRDVGLFKPYNHAIPLHVDIRNVLIAINLCITSSSIDNIYNVFNIADTWASIDISPARDILNYDPIQA